VALSPDGGSVVYQAASEGGRGLYLRALDELGATLLTDQSNNIAPPFVSWDGAWVAFFDANDDSLKRVSNVGGPVHTICRGCAGVPLGASWGADDTIIFGNNSPSGLWSVPADGGEPSELTTPKGPRLNHAWPEILPGGRAVLVESVPSLSIGAAEMLFEAQQYYSQIGFRQFDLAPDGRWLFLKLPIIGDTTASREIILIKNWFDELQRLVPTP